MKLKLDVRKYPPGHVFTVVQCEKCDVYYEPYGKIHKCKKGKQEGNRTYK